MSFSPLNDFFLQVAAGNIPGYEKFEKFGHNSAIGTTEEVIHILGATTPYFPTSSVTIEAISTDANDTAAGSGARTITVRGLDANFIEITEDIVMNGLLATAATAKSFIRVNFVIVKDVGTYGGSNAGGITVRASGAGSSFASMEANKSLSHSTVHTTPAGKELYITDVHFNVEANRSVFFTGYSRSAADVIAAPYSPAIAVKEFPGVIGAADFTYDTSPLVIPQKTDMWVAGSVIAGTANATVEYIGVLRTV